MNRIKPILIYIQIILLTLATSLFSQNNNKESLHNSIINLEGNWEYRRGDSPVDDKGNLLWLCDAANDTNWKYISKPSGVPFVSNLN